LIFINKFSGKEHYLLMQIRTGFNENVKNRYISIIFAQMDLPAYIRRRYWKAKSILGNVIRSLYPPIYMKVHEKNLSSMGSVPMLLQKMIYG